MQRLPQHTKDFSRQLRAEMTDAEKHLWQRLRMKQLGVKFRRQHPAGRYILDFACVDAALAIEIDGGQHNEMQIEDHLRSEWLKDHGWKVLRFWNNEVLQNIEGVLQVILQSINESDSGNVLPPP
ncbi:endonuclease domain-containing protein [Methylotenera sp.]|uniref:endonuclease domain-containing protein n=1 Tax=Methylotenera sp. TaxID=2051956 RepID=UPI0024881184|nr:endonuclease domain-containing protein [Methylotenera sp.]MDI1298362.1 endonuclease domain-containing protein [Methylotenera sp.]